MKLCTKCGKENADSSFCCSRCGADFTGDSFGKNFVQVKKLEKRELPLMKLPEKDDSRHAKPEKRVEDKYYILAGKSLKYALISIVFNPLFIFGVIAFCYGLISLMAFKDVKNNNRKYCIAGILIGIFSTVFWVYFMNKEVYNIISFLMPHIRSVL
jgi:hypothetical protein